MYLFAFVSKHFKGASAGESHFIQYELTSYRGGAGPPPTPLAAPWMSKVFIWVWFSTQIHQNQDTTERLHTIFIS